MGAKTEYSTTKADYAKWGVVLVLLLAGFVANYYFQNIAAPIRVIGWIVLSGITLGIAALTAKGKQAISFAKDARIELRKVVWPTRQEHVQMTIIVLLVVLGVAIVLWGVDTVLLLVIGILTGQRG